MAKTKPVRIATSGNTIDGRHIDPVMLQQAAKNFDPVTYPARINLEHIPGVTGQPPFQSYGDIISLKTEDITLDVGGKPEKRVALIAELDVTDDLIALNKKGQKLYTSIELYPNFADSKEAYVGGLAITDSPASLGTERLKDLLKFNRAKAFGAFVSEPTEFTLDLEASAVATSEAETFMTGVKNFLTGFSAKPADPPVPPVVTTAASAVAPDLAAFTTIMQEGFTKMFAAVEASAKASTAAVEKVSADLAAFKTEVEKAPANNYTQRPIATGGDGVITADC